MSGLKLFYWIGLSTNAGSGPNITPTFLCVSEFQGHLLLAVAALLVEEEVLIGFMAAKMWGRASFGGAVARLRPHPVWVEVAGKTRG